MRRKTKVGIHKKKMVDTFILSIPYRKVVTDAVNDRIGSKWHLQNRTPGYDKYVRNPSAIHTKDGLYFPRVTAYVRKGSGSSWKNAESSIRIEFSAPKLIYQNNVDELVEDQFESVVQTLLERLRVMNVLILPQNLSAAEVRAVHYSKNIELQNGYTSQYVITELGKINLNKRFDFAKTRYLNDGQSMVAHTIAHEFVIYDKMADLTQSKKRAIDKDQTPRQQSLFENLNKPKNPREILRIEVRLNQKRKLDAFFKQLGFAPSPTFKDAFSASKSKAVMKHYWETMIGGNAAILFAHSMSTKDLLRQILLANKKMRPKEAIYRASALTMAHEGNGMRELRSILGKRESAQTWRRTVADIRDTAARLDKLRPRDWFDQITQGFEAYTPLKTADLLCKQK